nr:ABC transporter permease [Hankyongella ginsenosidimutans]
MASPELYVIVDAIKKSSGTKANMPLRGIGPNGLALRANASIIEGRLFKPGSNEIVVGRGLLKEFSGFELGKTVRFGVNTWKVVGVFEADGSAFESELWADLPVIQSLFKRGNTAQTVRARLTSPAALKTLQDYIKSDPRLNVEAQSEKQFYAEQSKRLSSVIQSLGWPLGIAMALGASQGAEHHVQFGLRARRGNTHPAHHRLRQYFDVCRHHGGSHGADGPRCPVGYRHHLAVFRWPHRLHNRRQFLAGGV